MRPRLRTRRTPALGRPQTSEHPIPTPSGLATNTGPLATAAWLLARDLFPTERQWSVEISLCAGDSRFDIEIFAEEWGVAFRHDGRLSWIRVTDIPFVHGHDDFELLREIARLKDVGRLVRSLEQRHELAFDRAGAAIRTTIPDGEPAIRAWVATL